jgi:hypothetical protein
MTLWGVFFATPLPHEIRKEDVSFQTFSEKNKLFQHIFLKMANTLAERRAAAKKAGKVLVPVKKNGKTVKNKNGRVKYVMRAKKAGGRGRKSSAKKAKKRITKKQCAPKTRKGTHRYHKGYTRKDGKRVRGSCQSYKKAGGRAKPPKKSRRHVKASKRRGMHTIAQMKAKAKRMGKVYDAKTGKIRAPKKRGRKASAKRK